MGVRGAQDPGGDDPAALGEHAQDGGLADAGAAAGDERAAPFVTGGVTGFGAGFVAEDVTGGWGARSARRGGALGGAPHSTRDRPMHTSSTYSPSSRNSPGRTPSTAKPSEA